MSWIKDSGGFCSNGSQVAVILYFPQHLCSILPRVSCNPPTTASRNHTHSTFPKWLWELLWVETPGTVEGRIFTGITKISCSRATLTARWAAEVKTRCWSMIYFQHVHAQGEKFHWCHHAWLQQAQQEAMRLNCSDGRLSALHSRYSLDSCSHGDHLFLLKYPSSARWRFYSSSENYHITLCFVLVLVNTWAHQPSYAQQSCWYTLLNQDQSFSPVSLETAMKY